VDLAGPSPVLEVLKALARWHTAAYRVSLSSNWWIVQTVMEITAAMEV